jgi:hypothetical protein
MNIIKKIGDSRDQRSLSHTFRAKRFGFFLSLIKDLPRPLTILDIGGTVSFWDAMNFTDEAVHITLLNLEHETISRAGFTSVQGDATNLNFPDASFDIVFSNSVIEHLFDKDAQQKMASEIQRVGKSYFIQTPNYWFPLEPHWLFPFFQYLPVSWRVFLTRNFSLGHIKKTPDMDAAEKQVREIQLLTLSDMKLLFPDASIYFEKFLSLNKSFVAYRFQA